MGTDAWDPQCYERFRAERREPYDDLVALIAVRPGLRVVDLGCGTGDLTADLHRRLDAAETLGIDASARMLAQAPADPGDGLRFRAGDVGAFADTGRWDVVFSNAALQWIPDHPALFARLRAALAPGGQLAVQMPANFDHPSHTAAAAVAATPPFRDALVGPPRIRAVLPPEDYALLLDRLGAARQHVRLQVYGHHLASRDEVVTWTRGTLLTDYERRLPPGLFTDFVAAYRARLTALLPDERPFFFPFKRLLLWARF
ncbi:MAG: methyltransferase domain-containing protein [bacterium]|nr:methyltransferase domain-containing protein [bacterium]